MKALCVFDEAVQLFRKVWKYSCGAYAVREIRLFNSRTLSILSVSSISSKSARHYIHHRKPKFASYLSLQHRTVNIPGDTSQEYSPSLTCHRDDVSKDSTLTDQCLHNTVTTHAVQYSHIHKADIHTLYS